MKYLIGTVIVGLVGTGAVAGWQQTVLAERGTELDGRTQASAGRNVEKYQVAAALVRGEMTMDAAADRVAAVLATEPDTVERLRAERPGMSDREMAYRQLAKHVRAVRPGTPEAVEALAREAEAAAARPSAPGAVQVQ